MKMAKTVALGVLWGAMGPLQASDSTWTAGDSGTWDSPANWSAGIPGASGSAGTSVDIATINQSLSTAISLNNPWSLGGIAFTNANDTTTLLQGSGAFYLGSGGSITRSGGNATSASTVDLNLFLAGAYTFTSDGSGSLQIGSIGKTIQTSAASGTQTLVLRGASTSAANIVSSGISDGGSGGVVSLRKTDAGTWTLATANSYSGGTVIGAPSDNSEQGGILRVAANGALGSGTVTIRNSGTSGGTSNGGTLQLSNNSTISNTIALAGLRSTATSYHIQNFSGNNSIAAVNITTGASGVFAQGYRFNSLAGNLGIDSITTTTTTGANRNLYFSGDGNITIQTGITQGSVAPTLVQKTGTGTLTYAATSSSNYVGQTQIVGGTLLVNGLRASVATTVTESARTGYGSLSTGHYLVSSGATLGGSGRLQANTALANTNMILVQSGGFIAPGSATGNIGTFTLDGTSLSGADSHILNMAAGAEFNFNLAGDGSAADRIDFWGYSAGDALFANNEINFSLSGPQAGGTYTVELFRFYSDSGSTLTASDILSGLQIGDYDSALLSGLSLDYGVNSINLTYTVAPVPEPSTWALLGLGGGILLWLQRKKA